MKQIEANNVIKTLNWIACFGNFGQSNLEPKLNNKVYSCEIFLPLIKKTIIGLGYSKLESIDNLTKQASFAIDEYLKGHPANVFKPTSRKGRYILEEDESGFLNLYLTQEGVC